MNDPEWPFYIKFSFLASSNSRFTYTDSALIWTNYLICYMQIASVALLAKCLGCGAS